MKIQGLKVWLSENDTEKFANGYFGNGSWPCSNLAGNQVFVEFDPKNGDMIDYSGPEASNGEIMACLEACLSAATEEVRGTFAHCIR